MNQTTQHIEKPVTPHRVPSTVTPFQLTKLNSFLEEPSIANLHQIIELLSGGQCVVERTKYGYVATNKLYDVAMDKKAHIGLKQKLSQITTQNIIQAVEQAVLSKKEIPVIQKRIDSEISKSQLLVEQGVSDTTGENDFSEAAGILQRMRRLKILADAFAKKLS